MDTLSPSAPDQGERLSVSVLSFPTRLETRLWARAIAPSWPKESKQCSLEKEGESSRQEEANTIDLTGTHFCACANQKVYQAKPTTVSLASYCRSQPPLADSLSFHHKTANGHWRSGPSIQVTISFSLYSAAAKHVHSSLQRHSLSFHPWQYE